MTDKLVSISFEDFKDANETFLKGPILTDRYNNITYAENLQARELSHFECLYGSPRQIKKLERDTPIYVIEMNVDTNMIEGIGYIRYNLLQNPPEIYRDVRFVEWNKFVYCGDYHITREEFNQEFPEFVESLEYKLFRGKGNQKRGKGFTRLSANTYSENVFTETTLAEAIKQVFVTKYF